MGYGTSNEEGNQEDKEYLERGVAMMGETMDDGCAGTLQLLINTIILYHSGVARSLGRSILNRKPQVGFVKRAGLVALSPDTRFVSLSLGAIVYKPSLMITK